MSNKPRTDSNGYSSEFIAICAVFFLIGFNFSTWASRIPAIRDSALLIPATLGYALLARGIGSVAMIPVTGWLINKYGAHKTAYYFGCVVSLSLVPIFLSPNWIALAISLIILGGAGGGFNLAINALGANFETRMGISRMSTIHSWFGVGNLGGALIGAAATALLLSVQFHFLVASLLMFTIIIISFRFIPDERSTLRSSKLSWPDSSILWLALIIFLAACTEASIMNWIALFYSDYLETGEKIAAIGYTTYATALLMMRFLGDRLRSSISAQQLIIMGTLIAVFGIVVAVIGQDFYISSLGVFLIGAGVALTFPFVFSVAGKISANALAIVMIFGGIGELISQPILGVVIQKFGLDGGFYSIACIILVTTLCAWKAKLLHR